MKYKEKIEKMTKEELLDELHQIAHVLSEEIRHDTHPISSKAKITLSKAIRNSLKSRGYYDNPNNYPVLSHENPENTFKM